MEDKSFKDLIEGINSPLANNVEPVQAPAVETEPENVPEVNIAENEPIEENVEVNPVCIVDETATTFVSDDRFEATETEVEEPKKEKKEKKAKKEKKPNNGKLNALQIVLICVASVVAIWLAMYTTDHVLASYGVSPLFSKLTAEYEDGSASYKGLGYKVQFKFDDSGNLTQRVLPSWKDGPNDVNTAE